MSVGLCVGSVYILLVCGPRDEQAVRQIVKNCANFEAVTILGWCATMTSYMWHIGNTVIAVSSGEHFISVRAGQCQFAAISFRLRFGCQYFDMLDRMCNQLIGICFHIQ